MISTEAEVSSETTEEESSVDLTTAKAVSRERARDDLLKSTIEQDDYFGLKSQVTLKRLFEVSQLIYIVFFFCSWKHPIFCQH